MNNRLYGFFSGFPTHSFPVSIAELLCKELIQRNSLVFVSVWPSDHSKNDYESTGMHGMFAEIGLPFAQHHIIDDRMDSQLAEKIVFEASCIFLMGGHPGLQMQFLRDMGLDNVIRASSAPLFGVSAGAINMAIHSLDTKESPIPYKGLGLADITIKPHFELNNEQMLSSLLQISMNLPIYSTEDNSAIFVKGDKISTAGKIHRINKGEISTL